MEILAASNLATLLLRIPAMLLAVTARELAHAYCADALGDPGPRERGRVSFSPLAHLSEWGSVVILFLPFAWGKSVRYDSSRWANPARGEAKLAFSAISANFLLSTLFLFLYSLLYFQDQGAVTNGTNTSSLESASALSLATSFCLQAFLLNGLMTVVNLLPLPGFDGYRILHGLRPQSNWTRVILRLKPLACFSIILLIFFFREVFLLLLSPLLLLLTINEQLGALFTLPLFLYALGIAHFLHRSLKDPLENSFETDFRKLSTAFLILLSGFLLLSATDIPSLAHIGAILLLLAACFLVWPGSQEERAQAEILEDGKTIVGKFRILSREQRAKVLPENSAP